MEGGVNCVHYKNTLWASICVEPKLVTDIEQRLKLKASMTKSHNDKHNIVFYHRCDGRCGSVAPCSLVAFCFEIFMSRLQLVSGKATLKIG